MAIGAQRWFEFAGRGAGGDSRDQISRIFKSAVRALAGEGQQRMSGISDERNIASDHRPWCIHINRVPHVGSRSVGRGNRTLDD